MCSGPFPVARAPSWQLTQLLVMPVCSKRAGVHAAVLWQALQSSVVTMWFAGLPVAFELL
jgi:hypothetical protein